MVVHGLAVTTKPPFATRANARNAALYFGGLVYVDWPNVNADCRRYRLDNCKLSDPRRYVWIAKDCCTGNAGCDLFQQFQPLSTQTIFELHEACDVAARLRQTIDKSRADRIWRYREYDRNVASSSVKPPSS